MDPPFLETRMDAGRPGGPLLMNRKPENSSGHWWHRAAFMLCPLRLGGYSTLLHARQPRFESVEVVAEMTTRRWTPEEQAMLPLAVQLLQAAVDGFETSGPAPQQSELACEHCSAVLFQPVTLGDGRTVCKPCVRKVAGRLNGEAGTT